MKIYRFAFSVAFVCLAILGILRFVVDPSASAQESPAVIEPVGGGEFEFQPQDEITDAERAAIKAQIAESIEKLTREGRLEAASPQAPVTTVSPTALLIREPLFMWPYHAIELSACRT